MLASVLCVSPCVSQHKQHSRASRGGGKGLAEIGARLAGQLRRAQTGLLKLWQLGRGRISNQPVELGALSTVWHR